MSIGDPQGFNRYSYVQNDPVNFIDPSGMFSDEFVFHNVSGLGLGFYFDSLIPFNYLAYQINLSYTYGRTGSVRSYEGHSIFPWDFLPQNPYDVGDILRKARERENEREKAKALNTKAWMDYEGCVSKDPAAIEYSRALNAAILKASIPLPGPIAISRVTIRTATGAASLVSSANIFTLAFGGMLHVLLANPSVETKELRDKVRPVEEKCMKQNKEKYGFTPVQPYWYGKR